MGKLVFASYEEQRPDELQTWLNAKGVTSFACGFTSQEEKAQRYALQLFGVMRLHCMSKMHCKELDMPVDTESFKERLQAKTEEVRNAIFVVSSTPAIRELTHSMGGTLHAERSAGVHTLRENAPLQIEISRLLLPKHVTTA